jgi:tetratricopeptide (TPR) repeat protein
LAYTSQTNERVILLREVASLQIKLERYTEAVQTLEKALSFVAQDIVLLYSLVVVHQQMTDYAAALDVLEKRLLPLVGEQDQQARQLQGVLYLQAEQFERAQTIFVTLTKESKKQDNLPQQAEYYYYLAMAEHCQGHKVAARKAVNSALRRNRIHAAARTLYQELNGQPAAEEKKAEEESVKPIQDYFDPLDLDEFLEVLDIRDHLDKLVTYVEMRYWKNRDPRGKKPKLSHRTIVLMRIVMGFKDWNLNQLHEKLRSKKHGSPLRKLLELPDDPNELAVYTTFERRINVLGVYPLKFLMRQMVREAVQEGYIDVSNILLDTSLIAACTDLARFFPDSETGFSDEGAGWSYPKPWTGRVFGFKLSLASAKDGEPIDADVVPANPNDITLGKQAIRRLGRTFSPLNVKVEFVIADGGYCSDSLRQLVAEVLGAMPLFRFNPRAASQRQPQYTYLDDKEEWLKVKRQLRQLIERSFAQLKRHFGLNNLCIRGLTQVAQYVLSRCLAYLACVIVAHKLGRPDLKASPRRLLYSY